MDMCIVELNLGFLNLLKLWPLLPEMQVFLLPSKKKLIQNPVLSCHLTHVFYKVCENVGKKN